MQAVCRLRRTCEAPQTEPASEAPMDQGSLRRPQSLACGKSCRGTSAPIEQRPSVVFEHTTTERGLSVLGSGRSPTQTGMDNIMRPYEQPGPPDDAPKATAAAEDGGLGGLNWARLWFCRSTTPPGRRGHPRRPGGTSNATLRGEGLRRPLLEASLRVGRLVRGSKLCWFPPCAPRTIRPASQRPTPAPSRIARPWPPGRRRP